MGLGDRIRAFFAKKGSPALAELEGFVAERKGIEGFIEPRTPTSPTSLLLVDRDGAHLRARVREPEDAATFCEKHSIPVYDAQVIGYPRRMKEYEKKRRSAASENLDASIAELEKRLSEHDPNSPDH
ncbi:MAG: oxidoreductase [Actinomycetota bacterium]